MNKKLLHCVLKAITISWIDGVGKRWHSNWLCYLAFTITYHTTPHHNLPQCQVNDDTGHKIDEYVLVWASSNLVGTRLQNPIVDELLLLTSNNSVDIDNARTQKNRCLEKEFVTPIIQSKLLMSHHVHSKNFYAACAKFMELHALTLAARFYALSNNVIVKLTICAYPVDNYYPFHFHKWNILSCIHVFFKHSPVGRHY